MKNGDPITHPEPALAYIVQRRLVYPEVGCNACGWNVDLERIDPDEIDW